MLTRILSALVALPIAIFLIERGGFAYLGLASFVVLVALHEVAAMTQPGDRPSQVVMIALGFLLFLGIGSGHLGTLAGALVGFAGLLALLLWFLFRPRDLATAGARMGLAVLGVTWVGGLMGVLVLTRLLPDGPPWLYLGFAIAFGSDTGGYFAGRFLGKHKLYEAVSPKKTWEGAVGGAVASVLLSLALVLGLGAPKIEIAALVPLALGLAALGQMGDLAQSLLKRSMGVKDSGSIMPGHGGLFDRIDALIFVTLGLVLYAVVGLGQTPAFFTW